MEMSGQLHAPAALPPGKEPLVPIGYLRTLDTSMCLHRKSLEVYAKVTIVRPANAKKKLQIASREQEMGNASPLLGNTLLN
jgi:hypothetical protein